MHQHMCIKGDYVKFGISSAVKFLSNTGTGKVVIFTNSKLRSFDYVRALEQKLDEANSSVPIDVIHIHGSLLKAEKF